MLIKPNKKLAHYWP